MTATDLINQHKQIVSRGYYTDSTGNKVTQLKDLPTGITVKGNTLMVGDLKLVTVVMTGDTREVTYHNTDKFTALITKAIDNYNKVVKRNANGLYSDNDICDDYYGNGNITLTEKFKTQPVAHAITLDDLLAFAV